MTCLTLLDQQQHFMFQDYSHWFAQYHVPPGEVYKKTDRGAEVAHTFYTARQRSRFPELSPTVDVVRVEKQTECDACGGYGFLITARSGPNGEPDWLAVERCDDCFWYDYDETVAAELAASGFAVRTNYPCYLLEQPYSGLPPEQVTDLLALVPQQAQPGRGLTEQQPPGYDHPRQREPNPADPDGLYPLEIPMRAPPAEDWRGTDFQVVAVLDMESTVGIPDPDVIERWMRQHLVIPGSEINMWAVKVFRSPSELVNSLRDGQVQFPPRPTQPRTRAIQLDGGNDAAQ